MINYQDLFKFTAFFTPKPVPVPVPVLAEDIKLAISKYSRELVTAELDLRVIAGQVRVLEEQIRYLNRATAKLSNPETAGELIESYREAYQKFR